MAGVSLACTRHQVYLVGADGPARVGLGCPLNDHRIWGGNTMEGSRWARRSERRVRMNEAAEIMGETSGMRARDWRMGAVLLLVLLLAVLLAARPADAQPRIKVAGCNVYATNRVDPIAFSQHLHHQFGSTTTTNSSTGSSLLAANKTSCKASWFTSAGWFPMAKSVPLYPQEPGGGVLPRPWRPDESEGHPDRARDRCP